MTAYCYLLHYCISSFVGYDLFFLTRAPIHFPALLILRRLGIAITPEELCGFLHNLFSDFDEVRGN